MKKIKVLHVLPSNRYSGAENVVCQIISMFKNQSNYEMVYCSLDGPIRAALEEREVPFHALKKASVAEIRNVICEEEPNIVHAHDMLASFLVAVACGSMPFISHIHNNNVNSRGIGLKSFLFYLAAKKARHIFWVSKSSFDGYKFHAQFENKSDVLYNTIDGDALRRKAEIDQNHYCYDLVYLGRLTYQKNPQRLMSVISKLIKKKSDVKVAVIGTGDLEAKTKAYAEELKLNNHVDFLGFQSNPYQILCDSKAMIMTSRWEGTPMCALEAMALGVPIITTPTDGLCELVVDGETGYLSDDDEVLAGCCAHVINDQDLHTRLTDAIRERAFQLLDTVKYQQALDRIYNKVLK